MKASQQNQFLQRSLSDRSSSVATSVNFKNNLQTPKQDTINERYSDSEKFDTLLMLAAERTNYLDHRRKKYFHDSPTERQRRYLSESPQQKDIPLVLIKQQKSSYEPSVRSHQVRFSTSEGML